MDRQQRQYPDPAGVGAAGRGQSVARRDGAFFASRYTTRAEFNLAEVKEYQRNDNVEYGLPGDDYDNVRRLLLTQDSRLILEPHDGDEFLFEWFDELTTKPKTTIPLRAREEVRWYVQCADIANPQDLRCEEGSEFIGTGAELAWRPAAPNTYTIEAKKDNEVRERVRVTITTEE